jgi:hypothetical protein
VSFRHSGITKIGNLIIQSRNHWGDAANFDGCQSLEVAEGTFPGFVDFSASGINTVGNLVIVKPNIHGLKSDFSDCGYLRLKAEYLGPEFEMDDYARQKNLERIATAEAQRLQPEIEI